MHEQIAFKERSSNTHHPTRGHFSKPTHQLKHQLKIEPRGHFSMESRVSKYAVRAPLPFAEIVADPLTLEQLQPPSMHPSNE